MIVNNLSYEINSKAMLSDVSFTVNEGDKVGLLGKNGSGKTTLLKIIMGEIESNKGTIDLQNEKVAILKQEIEKKYNNYTIIDYLKEVCKINKIEKEMENFNFETDDINHYYSLLERFNDLDGYNFTYKVEKSIKDINLKKDINSKISMLSGGEKIKLLIIELVLQNADFLLLDEPTNNLDANTIGFLKDFLKNSKRKMIIISHDEDFLDEIINRVFYLEDGKLSIFNMNYSEYLKQKENEYNQNMLEYENAIIEKNKLKNRLQKAKEWENKGLNKKAHNDNDKKANDYAKEKTKNSQISKLNKEIKNLDIPKFKYKLELDYFFNFNEDKGNKDINLNDLVIGYKKFNIGPINVSIPFGTKLSIVGSNGTGKTTLIKTILGEIPVIEGKINIGNSINFGYISQETFLEHKDDIDIYNYITEGQEEIDKSLIFNILNKFDISYSDRNKKYNLLSPGERTRVNLAKFAVNNTNVIILNEPTNHLDVEGISVIYDLIKSYKGTIISISHNKKYNKILNPNKILNIETCKMIKE